MTMIGPPILCQHHRGEARCKQLWEKLNQPRLGIPEHVVTGGAKLLMVLVA